MRVVVIDVPTFPGYGITACGKVYRYPYTRRGIKGLYTTALREISVNMNAEYPQLEMHRNGKRMTAKLHRILSETFLPNPDGLPQVNHKDGNKFNYNLDNLEWVSASANVRHSYAEGLASNKGSRHPSSILDERQVTVIKHLIEAGCSTNTELAKTFGVHHSTISKIRRGKLWRHVKQE